jgi:hypothetical protein
VDGVEPADRLDRKGTPRDGQLDGWSDPTPSPSITSRAKESIDIHRAPRRTITRRSEGTTMTYCPAIPPAQYESARYLKATATP